MPRKCQLPARDRIQNLARLESDLASVEFPAYGDLYFRRSNIENSEPKLFNPTILQSHSKPVLWHTDLHLGNVFVAEDNPAEIVSFIGWQFSRVFPMFTQAHWPIFLNPPEGYRTGKIELKLPPNYKGMDDDEKRFAMAEKDQAIRTKCYEAASVRYQRNAILALTKIDKTIRDPFVRCYKTYKASSLLEIV